MKFGAMQSVLGEALPAVFLIAADLGFDGVELDWFERSAVQEGGALAPAARVNVKAAARAARAAGIEIPSICAHFLDDFSLAHPNGEKRRLGLDGIGLGLRLCQDVGAHVLLVPSFGDELDDHAGVERLVGHLREIAPEARTTGVRIALEHRLSSDDAIAIFAAVGSPWIGDYWDMGNALAFGYEPVHEARTLGRHLMQAHAKEYDGGDGQPAAHNVPRYDGLNRRPLGQGQVSLTIVIQELGRIGYDGYVVLETEAFGDKRASAAAALGVLRAAHAAL